MDWRNFLDKFEISNYIIGDLDNIFDNSLSIIDSNVIDGFGSDLIANDKITHLKIRMSAQWINLKSAIVAKYVERKYFNRR